MNKQKQTYLSPETETLVVRFEGVVCASYGDEGKPGGDPGLDDDDYNFGGF